jgi:hypothetical protein
MQKLIVIQVQIFKVCCVDRYVCHIPSHLSCGRRKQKVISNFWIHLPTVKLEELERLVFEAWQIAAPKKLKEKNRA